MDFKLDAPGLQLVQPPDYRLCSHNLPCGMCPYGAEPGCPDYNSTESDSWYLHNTFRFGPQAPYGIYTPDADVDEYFQLDVEEQRYYRFIRKYVSNFPHYDPDDIPF